MCGSFRLQLGQLVRGEDTGVVCGSTPRRRTWIDLAFDSSSSTVVGRDPAGADAILRATDPTDDIPLGLPGYDLPDDSVGGGDGHLGARIALL
jgi:hypothetical protein